MKKTFTLLLLITTLSFCKKDDQITLKVLEVKSVEISRFGGSITYNDEFTVSSKATLTVVGSESFLNPVITKISDDKYLVKTTRGNALHSYTLQISNGSEQITYEFKDN